MENSSKICPKVSVIVPCYNVREYVGECLKSLVNQTFSDIEIIVINDGSTDDTLNIISEFGDKDSRIKLINQENKGLSVARNSGIDCAAGKYITFVDSDDWVDNDFIEKLHSAIKAENADIASSSIIRYRKNFQKFRVHYTENKVFSSLEDKIEAANVPKCCYVWSKLYKTELVKNYKFRQGAYFEDVLWTPEILKNSGKMVTVPDVNYYYRVNKKSIVKKPSKKKIEDNYYAKKYMVDFLRKNNLPLEKKCLNITKSVKYLFNLPVLKIKESRDFETWFLFNVIPVFKKKLKTPVIKQNTVLIWEPCLKNHSEVVPGYAKYFLDLGYHVSILLNPERYKERLFERFTKCNISYNKMSRKEIKEFFKRDNLDNVKCVLVTTGGKLCDKVNIEDCYKAFSPNADKEKLFFVFHDAKPAVDNGTWKDDIITLRALNYKDAQSVVINPHYFGEVNIITPKNNVTNFITIGAIQGKKKNNDLIINAVKALLDKRITDFKVTVVGKGHLKKLPPEIRPYIDIKGRLPFDKMYEEIEKADFILTSYETDNPNHIFYNTSGTSGNFQLVYGFLKPVVIIESFAPVNGFNDENSILYKDDTGYAAALEKGINMSAEGYKIMQEKLKEYQQKVYKQSLQNLEKLISKRGLNG